MAKNYFDPKHELRNMVLNLFFSAMKEEQKINKLIGRVNLITNERQVRHEAKDFLYDINTIKDSQRLLKSDFAKIAMKFCQIIDHDCDFFSFLRVLLVEVGNILRRKEALTEKEISLATQEIKAFGEKQEGLIKKRKDLKVKFLKSFPCEKYTCDDRIGIDLTRRRKCSETWISWQILEPLDMEDKSLNLLMPWNLTMVLTRMYGFELIRATREEFVFKQYLEKGLYIGSKKCKGLIGSEVLERRKRKLEALLCAIEAIKKCSEREEEIREAKELMIKWLYGIEGEIFFIAVDLLALASDCDRSEAEKIHRAFRLKLVKLQQKNGGRVLVVVYRLLALLGGVFFRDSVGELAREESRLVHCYCSGENESERIKLLSNIRGVLQIRVYGMIRSLMSVLYANSGLSCRRLSAKEALLGSVEIVENCDEQWRAIRANIDKVTMRD